MFQYYMKQSRTTVRYGRFYVDGMEVSIGKKTNLKSLVSWLVQERASLPTIENARINSKMFNSLLRWVYGQTGAGSK